MGGSPQFPFFIFVDRFGFELPECYLHNRSVLVAFFVEDIPLTVSLNLILSVQTLTRLLLAKTELVTLGKLTQRRLPQVTRFRMLAVLRPSKRGQGSSALACFLTQAAVGIRNSLTYLLLHPVLFFFLVILSHAWPLQVHQNQVPSLPSQRWECRACCRHCSHLGRPQRGRRAIFAFSRICVHVYRRSNQSTIHFHGNSNVRADYERGSYQRTQCPSDPG